MISFTNFSSVRARTVVLAVMLLFPLVLSVAPTGADTGTVVKQCVDGRQTQDPNSPPCQSTFTGSNGGSTWQGVTDDEITVLFVADAGLVGDGRTVESTPPSGTYCDVSLLDCNGDGAPDEKAHPQLRAANALMRYFNARMQTYDRHVSAYIYWTRSDTPSSRRADAAENWEALKPFAVIDLTRFSGHQATYAQAMAARQTMVFGSFKSMSRALMASSAPMVWSLWPDVESSAHHMASYLCTKVKGTSVSAGVHTGESRRLGIYYDFDPDASYRLLAELVRAGVNGCGMSVSVEAHFSSSSGADGRLLDSALALAEFRTASVNTLLWIGGPDPSFAQLADASGYQPEVIAVGDGVIDSPATARWQGALWSNAWVVSSRPLSDGSSSDPGYLAYKEAEPSGEDVLWARRMYPDLFLLFHAIQLAGPTLDPTNVEIALRAIQPNTSTGPYDLAVYAVPGGYSMVQDAVEGWWDPSGGVDSGLGCYRLVDGGKRFLANSWSHATGAGLGLRSEDGGPDGLERVRSRDTCSDWPLNPQRTLF